MCVHIHIYIYIYIYTPTPRAQDGPWRVPRGVGDPEVP